jgi:imidazolonepropionase
MTTTLLTNIGLLATHNDELEELPRAAVVLDGDQIAWVGSAASAPDADERVDLDGRAMIPGFVDSHAHLVFSGDRAAEFAARMSGQAYAAGGIRTTVAATRQASDETLRANVARLSAEMLAAGITTFECKSGYGLDVPTEERALRIAGEFTSETTYLGAHVVPAEMERDAYVDLVCGEMLTAAVPHARWIDVFCEKGAFDGDETRRILEVGLAQGLIPRVHANQLTEGPGVQLAVELGAASADHCTHLSDADIDALAGSDTVATLLPLAEFSTRAQYPDARRVIDAGVTVALATDCNPGSAYSTSMPLAIALAVRDMHMTPAEAVHAATALGAQALRRDDVGVIAVGKRADVVVLDASSYVHLAYRPGVPLISQVWQSGRRIGLA